VPAVTRLPGQLTEPPLAEQDVALLLLQLIVVVPRNATLCGLAERLTPTGGGGGGGGGPGWIVTPALLAAPQSPSVLQAVTVTNRVAPTSPAPTLMAGPAAPLFQAYEKPASGKQVDVQLPGEALSVPPGCGLPEIVGAATFVTTPQTAFGARPIVQARNAACSSDVPAGSGSPQT
jgi:hypothetical protein